MACTSLININISSQEQTSHDALVHELARARGKEKINILNQLSANFLDKNPSKAISLGEEALELSNQYTDLKEKKTALENLGTAYFNIGKFGEASKNFQSAYKLSMLLGDKKDICHSLLNMGNVLTSLGKYDEALEKFLEAEDYALEFDDKNLLVKINSSLGNLYNYLSNYDKALDFFYHSLSIKKETNDLEGIANAYKNIGNIYGSLGNYDLAFNFYFDALEKFKEMDDLKGSCVTYINLGLLYKKWGKYDKARDYLFQAIEPAKIIGNNDLIAKVYFHLGDINSIVNNFPSARKYLVDAFKIAKTSNNKVLIRDINLSLANLYAEKKKFQLAYHHYLLFSQMDDSLFNEEINNKITRLQIAETEDENSLLRKDLRIQNLELAKQKSLRNTYIISLVFITLLSIVLYMLFRSRKKHGQRLTLLNNKLEELVRERTRELELEIQEKKKSEDALEANKEKYREIIEYLPITYSELDKNLNFTFINKAGLELTGYTADELNNGTSLLDLLPPQENLKENLRRAASAFNNSMEQYQLKRKNGELIDVLVKSTPVFAENQLKGIRSTVIDITRLNNMNKALKESEEKFRELSEMLPETVYEFDLKGNFSFINNAGLAMFGLTLTDLKKGLSVYEVISKKDHEKLEKEIQNTFEGKKIRGIEFTALRKDKTKFPILVYANAIVRQGAPIGIRGIVTDIAERKQLENRLKQSQKLQSLGTLAGGIAHDFNNILMGMQLFTELSYKLVEDNLKARKSIEKVLDAQSRAKDLIKQILTFSSQSGDEKSPIKIHETVEDVVNMIASTFPSSIKLNKSINDCGYVLGNPAQIHQIIMNLCTNANHAMQGSGNLKISLELVRTKSLDKSLKIRTNYTKCIQLTVEDNGSGMDKRTRERIFDPFFTTKKVGLGTGLGMATVFGIVKQYGGEINFTSEIGKGTTFYIYLPVYKLD